MDNIRKFQAHPQSAPGDFYVVNHECTSCGAPHVVAPDLIGWSNAEMDHCIWTKQPENQEEVERAFAAFDACCIGCYRYAGNDSAVMNRLGQDYCDHVIRPDQIERRAEGDDSSVEIPLSLAASNETKIGSVLKRMIAKVVSMFRR